MSDRTNGRQVARVCVRKMEIPCTVGGIVRGENGKRK